MRTSSSNSLGLSLCGVRVLDLRDSELREGSRDPSVTNWEDHAKPRHSRSGRSRRCLNDGSAFRVAYCA